MVMVGIPSPFPESVFNKMWVNGFLGLKGRVGRITPSFRRLLIAEIERLYKRYRPSLRDPDLQEALQSFIDRYLTRYREIRDISLTELKAWRLPIAIARLNDDIPHEKEWLTSLIKEELDSTP